jgi:hypothetical protein
MKYLKRYNESKITIVRSGSKIVAPIRSEIEDILIEFKTNYDIKFVQHDYYLNYYETTDSKDNFQLQIIPKGYPDSGDVEPILIDGDILDDLGRVCSFIKNEIDFKYSHSYYFINHDYKRINSDIFESEGKLVTMIQMFFVGQKRLLV